MELKYETRLGRTAQMLHEIDAHLFESPVGSKNVWISARFHLSATKTHEGVTVVVHHPEGRLWVADGPTVTLALQKITALEWALLTLVDRGKIYPLKTDRAVIRVWHKDVAVHKNLVGVFGGNYYRHGSGLVWVCSKRSVLARVLRLLAKHDLRMRDQEILEERYADANTDV